jgi:hypothetical protein
MHSSWSWRVKASLIRWWRSGATSQGVGLCHFEDFIDDFTHRAGSTDAKAGYIEKISHYVSALRGRQANQELKDSPAGDKLNAPPLVLALWVWGLLILDCPRSTQGVDRAISLVRCWWTKGWSCSTGHGWKGTAKSCVNRRTPLNGSLLVMRLFQSPKGLIWQGFSTAYGRSFVSKSLLKLRLVLLGVVASAPWALRPAPFDAEERAGASVVARQARAVASALEPGRALPPGRYRSHYCPSL